MSWNFRSAFPLVVKSLTFSFTVTFSFWRMCLLSCRVHVLLGWLILLLGWSGSCSCGLWVWWNNCLRHWCTFDRLLCDLSWFVSHPRSLHFLRCRLTSSTFWFLRSWGVFRTAPFPFGTYLMFYHQEHRPCWTEWWFWYLVSFCGTSLCGLSRLVLFWTLSFLRLVTASHLFLIRNFRSVAFHLLLPLFLQRKLLSISFSE